MNKNEFKPKISVFDPNQILGFIKSMFEMQARLQKC